MRGTRRGRMHGGHLTGGPQGHQQAVQHGLSAVATVRLTREARQERRRVPELALVTPGIAACVMKEPQLSLAWNAFCVSVRSARLTWVATVESVSHGEERLRSLLCPFLRPL